MSGRMPILLAVGSAIGVIVAYLLAGGASYEPLEVADPCEPRPLEVLAERDAFEGIALSALDGAACELRVTREELTAALADDAALAAFATEHGLDQDEIVAAVRAGLSRSIDDAELQGLIPGPVADLGRLVAARAPVGAVIDLFAALPGDPTLADLIDAIAELDIDIADLDELGSQGLEDLRDAVGSLLGPEGVDGVPQSPEDLPPALRDLLP